MAARLCRASQTKAATLRSRLTNYLRGAVKLLQRVRKKFLSPANDFCLSRASEIPQPAHVNRRINYMNITTSPIRNSVKRSLLRQGFGLITLVLGCFALLPGAQAVSPAPDGGYAGSNTAEGTNALFSRTTGVWNTALGYQALYQDTSGNSNTAVGLNALFKNINGGQNTANGVYALYSNVSGSFNTAVGFQALLKNDTDKNTAIGAYALASDTSGGNNTAVGTNALRSNTTAGANTAVGMDALYHNTTTYYNTATGFEALFSNTYGFDNTANGAFALLSNTGGVRNTATGSQALYRNTSGLSNTANGVQALGSNTTGYGNIAVGDSAGYNLTTGNSNIDIGNGGLSGESGTIRIGNGSQTRTFVAGINGVAVTGAGVVVNASGQLGTAPSSERFKDRIKPMDKASEAILALKPVTFRYKKSIDPESTLQFGLVAEEVEKVNPDLVARDAEGKPYTVRYDAVNAMLLNEFLKAHRKVQEQEATIAQLKSTVAKQEMNSAEQQKEIQALASNLKEQASQIQKVSAELELQKAPAETLVSYQ
jgi:uncharacterized coiled-coil protein SlyX